jgi:hypothetical protein
MDHTSQSTPSRPQTASDEPMRYELRHDSQQLCRDMRVYFKAYARENPETVALWCLGVGFVLGWKLKPW